MFTALLATLFVDMSPIETILTYVGIPLLVVVVVVLIAAGPSWTRAGRDRPGVTWDATTWLGDQPQRRDDGTAGERIDPGGSSARW